MSDLKIVESAIEDVEKNLSSVQSALDATHDAMLQPDRGNVGSQEMVNAVSHFLDRMSRFKNRYKENLQKLSENLDKVKQGSDDVDQGLQHAVLGNGKS